ncbi:MAG: hypothetical protein AAGK93_03825 [Pseudomonadota bacterium]
MHLPGKLNPVAAILIYGGLGLVVLAFLGVSGVANVNVWWNSAEGWSRYVFTTIGVGAEIWGALGLLLMTRRFAQGQWLKALICFALWTPAVAFNGYSTYRFFVIEGAQVAGTDETAKTALELAEDRIPEITTELSAIGVTRTPEAITAERDQLPENYRTRRAELNAELATAERRTRLEDELAQSRATVLANASADTTPSETTISDNRVWIALVIWMEAIKALALWVMFGRTGSLREPAEGVYEEEEPELPENPQEALLSARAAAERVIVTPSGEERRVRVL